MGGFSDQDLRDLRSLLQMAVLRDYPNAERVSCPGTHVLEEIATAPRAFEHPAYSHIRVCAPCLQEMLDMRQKEILRRLDFSRKRHKRILWATAVTVFLIVVFGSAVARSRNSGFRFGLTSGAQSAALPSPEHSVLIAVDLSSFSRTRGAAATLPVVAIPATIVHLRMILPFGSDDGRYDLELREGSDRIAFASTGVAEIKEGDTILSLPKLDLSHIPPGHYELFFRHADASWQHVSVLIGATHG